MPLGDIRDKLLAEGVEVLGITATNARRARLYLRMRPTKLPLVADPDATTHQRYSVPQIPRADITPAMLEEWQQIKVNPRGLLPQPVPVYEAASALIAQDERQGEPPYTPDDLADWDRQGALSIGQFLVDAEGIIRWANIEGEQDGPADLGQFPSEEELLAAARAL